jgi:hypothetical protein
MDATVLDLTFPVLCLARDSSIAVAQNADELARCNARAFYRSRYFDQLLVIDSKATQYSVAAARPPSELLGLRRLLVRLFNRQFRVPLQLAPTGVASLADAKTRVLEHLGRAPHFWEESRDLAEWKELIARARDIEQIVRLFE